MTEAKTGLALLREPFPKHLISKLPKPTKAQTEEVKADFKRGHRCEDCGAWHAKGVVHLDYVGHAALTDRLLDADPAWAWEPLAMADSGLPVMDSMGGMWIKLTVCGVTRIGYGHAVEKTTSGAESGGNAIKEVIGDALRNAAMRFGAALDLWHKGQLHAEDEQPKKIGASASDGLRASFDALAPDLQNSIRLVTQQASKLVAAGDLKRAIDLIVAQQDEHDNDMHDRSEITKAQWYLLDSGTRRKIKEEQAK